MKHSKEFALAIAALVDQLAASMPSLAVECIAFADFLRRAAGPEDPPIAPPPAEG
jgi:hypothetical protein